MKQIYLCMNNNDMKHVAVDQGSVTAPYHERHSYYDKEAKPIIIIFFNYRLILFYIWELSFNLF